MLIDRLNIKDTGEEILPHENEAFPHTSYYVEPEKFPDRTIPWHWHEDLEVLYVVQGEIELTTPAGCYNLSAGDAAYINTNVVHQQKPKGKLKVITLNQVFHPSIIYGSVNSIFYLKYVYPIMSCKEIDVVKFEQSQVKHRQITEYIKISQDVSDEHLPGYEIKARNALSSMWLLLYEISYEKISEKKITPSLSVDRLKLMMEYISNNYMDRVTLKEIAYAANISEREAIRTFNNNIKMSPFAYLMEYRLRMATLQLTTTKDSISKIAYDCGFSSASYFGKEFKKSRGCSALEYRRGDVQ